MLRDGSFKPVSEVTITESLMPLNVKLSSKADKNTTIEGYEMVWDTNSEKWIFTHKLSDIYNLEHAVYTKEQGATCHHKDFHKLNNNPTNLVRMTCEDHFKLHCDTIEKTLHTPEVKLKSIQAKRTAEYRAKARSKSLEKRELFSQNAKKQWNDPDYKEYMNEMYALFYESHPEYQKANRENLMKAQREYWSNEENRQQQAQRVKQYFEAHPEAKDVLTTAAFVEWQDESLLKWRSNKTKEQWTQDFRAKRKQALAKTYYNKTIQMLKHFMESNKDLVLEQYNDYKAIVRDKSLLRFDTFCDKYFGGDKASAWETVKNYNHKIVKIEKLTERVDVYDAEVPNTHNFALAAGIFVHNSAKQGRNREIQAILPLFGKVLNTERARLDKIIDSDKFKTLIVAIGTGIGEQYNPSKLRYNKVIIMADADADGSHIKTLYLTFFYRHMPELIANGHIYAAQPPLYKAVWGKEKRYLFDDAERQAFLKTPEGQKAITQRFKGLGEMNAEELWETTMNPDTRRLKQIQIDDAAKADEVFTMLMGDEVPPRKRFIQTHAKSANVDKQ
jgi:DNA gyrase subunit B